MKGTWAAAYNVGINTETCNKSGSIYKNEGFPVAWAAVWTLSEPQKDPSVSASLQLETALYTSFSPIMREEGKKHI